jgi:hypothetical protein
MFGVKFIKVQPTDYVLQYRKGRLVREGVGQAFFYFAPTSSLVRIPVGSVDVPFQNLKMSTAIDSAHFAASIHVLNLLMLQFA